VVSVWSFLSNQGLVLLAIAADPTATQREIGDAVGLTERATQRLIAELVDAGYVRRFVEGRRNRYEIVGDTRIRHPLGRDVRVRELLEVLAPTNDG
jgi:DNA-binding Lrp family transcriptional regulator